MRLPFHQLNSVVEGISSASCHRISSFARLCTTNKYIPPCWISERSETCLQTHECSSFSFRDSRSKFRWTTFSSSRSEIATYRAHIHTPTLNRGCRPSLSCEILHEISSCFSLGDIQNMPLVASRCPISPWLKPTIYTRYTYFLHAKITSIAVTSLLSSRSLHDNLQNSQAPDLPLIPVEYSPRFSTFTLSLLIRAKSDTTFRSRRRPTTHYQLVHGFNHMIIMSRFASVSPMTATT